MKRIHPYATWIGVHEAFNYNTDGFDESIRRTAMLLSMGLTGWTINPNDAITMSATSAAGKYIIDVSVLSATTLLMPSGYWVTFPVGTYSFDVNISPGTDITGWVISDKDFEHNTTLISGIYNSDSSVGASGWYDEHSVCAYNMDTSAYDTQYYPYLVDAMSSTPTCGRGSLSGFVLVSGSTPAIDSVSAKYENIDTSISARKVLPFNSEIQKLFELSGSSAMTVTVQSSNEIVLPHASATPSGSIMLTNTTAVSGIDKYFAQAVTNHENINDINTLIANENTGIFLAQPFGGIMFSETASNPNLETSGKFLLYGTWMPGGYDTVTGMTTPPTGLTHYAYHSGSNIVVVGSTATSANLYEYDVTSDIFTNVLTVSAPTQDNSFFYKNDYFGVLEDGLLTVWPTNSGTTASSAYQYTLTGHAGGNAAFIDDTSGIYVVGGDDFDSNSGTRVSFLPSGDWPSTGSFSNIANILGSPEQMIGAQTSAGLMSGIGKFYLLPSLSIDDISSAISGEGDEATSQADWEASPSYKNTDTAVSPGDVLLSYKTGSWPNELSFTMTGAWQDAYDYAYTANSGWPDPPTPGSYYDYNSARQLSAADEYGYYENKGDYEHMRQSYDHVAEINAAWNDIPDTANIIIGVSSISWFDNANTSYRHGIYVDSSIHYSSLSSVSVDSWLSAHSTWSTDPRDGSAWTKEKIRDDITYSSFVAWVLSDNVWITNVNMYIKWSNVAEDGYIYVDLTPSGTGTEKSFWSSEIEPSGTNMTYRATGSNSPITGFEEPVETSGFFIVGASGGGDLGLYGMDPSTGWTTSQNMPGEINLAGVAWKSGFGFMAIGNTRHAASAEGGPYQILIESSPWGVDDWTEHDPGPFANQNPGRPSTMGGIAYNPLLDVWVIVGGSRDVGPYDSRSIFSSNNDGETWLDKSVGDPSPPASLYGVIWANPSGVSVSGSSGIFLAWGHDDWGSSWQSHLMYSYQGGGWTNIDMGLRPIGGICEGNDQFVAVGTQYSEEDARIWTSRDGLNWTLQPAPASGALQAVVWNGSIYCAIGTYRIGNTSGSHTLTSVDGSAWVPQINPLSGDFNSIEWNGQQFVAVGDNGIIVTSPDGISWTDRSLTGTQNLDQIITGFGEMNAAFSAVSYGDAVGNYDYYRVKNLLSGNTSGTPTLQSVQIADSGPKGRLAKGLNQMLYYDNASVSNVTPPPFPVSGNLNNRNNIVTYSNIVSWKHLLLCVGGESSARYNTSIFAYDTSNDTWFDSGITVDRILTSSIPETIYMQDGWSGDISSLSDGLDSSWIIHDADLGYYSWPINFSTSSISHMIMYFRARKSGEPWHGDGFLQTGLWASSSAADRVVGSLITIPVGTAGLDINDYSYDMTSLIINNPTYNQGIGLLNASVAGGNYVIYEAHVEIDYFKSNPYTVSVIGDTLYIFSSDSQTLVRKTELYEPLVGFVKRGI